MKDKGLKPEPLATFHASENLFLAQAIACGIPIAPPKPTIKAIIPAKGRNFNEPTQINFVAIITSGVTPRLAEKKI